MVRQKDPFWEYVQPSNGRFVCNFCVKDFASGVPRIKSHLSGIKGRDIEICLNVPPDVQAKAFQVIQGSNKKSKDSSFSVETRDLSSRSDNGTQVCTIPGMLKNKDKDEVDKSVAKCFIMNNIAFNVIQTKSFIEMCSNLANYGVGYKVPPFSTLRNKLVDGAKIDIDKYVASVKKSWVKGGCTIMFDTWSDRRQRSFINVVSYSPSGAVFLKATDFSGETHTSIKIKDIISLVIDDIGPEYVVQIVTDNATNYTAPGEMLVGKYPHLYKTRCAAHGIQLLLKDIYKQVEFVHNAINDCKAIRDYLYKHTIVLNLMRKHTKNKELKKSCTTRFASSFKMLESILDVENELRMLVACTEWRGINHSKSVAARNTTDIIQRQDFWEEGKKVKKVLEPLVCVLRLVDGDGSTSGYLYEAIERACESIKNIAVENPAKYARILQLFKTRREENIIHDIHQAAAFLNPAFMYKDNFNETSRMKTGIIYVANFLVADEERFDFLREVQLYRMKAQTLFTPTAISMLQTAHPRIWWDFCGDSLPVFKKKHAVRILSQPCSSSACERHWSAFEAAQTKKRNRLTPKMLDNLVYTRMNTIAIEKFGELEVQDLEPINLKNLPELPDYIDPPIDGDDEEDATDPDDHDFDDDILVLDE